MRLIEPVPDIIEHRDDPDLRTGVPAHYYDVAASAPPNARQVMLDSFSDDELGRAVAMQCEVLSVTRDESGVLVDDAAHAVAPLAAFALLAGVDVSNRLERRGLPPVLTPEARHEGGVALYDRESGRVSTLTSPAFIGTRAIVGLDSTPTPDL